MLWAFLCSWSAQKQKMASQSQTWRIDLKKSKGQGRSQFDEKLSCRSWWCMLLNAKHCVSETMAFDHSKKGFVATWSKGKMFRINATGDPPPLIDNHGCKRRWLTNARQHWTVWNADMKVCLNPTNFWSEINCQIDEMFLTGKTNSWCANSVFDFSKVSLCFWEEGNKCSKDISSCAFIANRATPAFVTEPIGCDISLIDFSTPMTSLTVRIRGKVRSVGTFVLFRQARFFANFLKQMNVLQLIVHRIPFVIVSCICFLVVKTFQMGRLIKTLCLNLFGKMPSNQQTWLIAVPVPGCSCRYWNQQEAGQRVGIKGTRVRVNSLCRRSVMWSLICNQHSLASQECHVKRQQLFICQDWRWLQN